MISDALVHELRSRADLLELMAPSVELRKQGREWVGLCPFHAERSPSFSVNKAKGYYKCWGCGESGDVYSWLQKTRGLSFGDAVKALADHLGTPIGDTNGKKNGKSYDPVAMARAREEADAVRTAQQIKLWDRMSLHLEAMWKRARPASPDHPYLVRKGVTTADGLRVTRDNRLLVPMRDVQTGRLMSVQAITPRFKRFAKRARAKGTRCTVGFSPDAVRLASSGAAPVYLAEGYATAWTVVQATKGACVCAFSTHNLTPVATALRAKYPTATIVIAADNDRWTGQAGHRYATEAALAVGALIVLPRFTTGCQDPSCDRKCGKAHPTDFNDLMATEGLATVTAQLMSAAAATPPPAEPEPEAPAGVDPDLDLTHDGLALELGEEWQNTGRHVALWGHWLFFNGYHWVEDGTLEHMTGARYFLRMKAKKLTAWAETKAVAIIADSGDEVAAKKTRGWAENQNKFLRSHVTIAQVVSLTRSNVHQAATTKQWDSDPWMIGTPRGTLDLRTGELRAARHTDYITKATAVVPAEPETLAPIWLGFLERITDGDERLQSYLQRFAGYSLTGLIDEHAFVFGYGTGANGKGTFINTLSAIMGDYAVTIPTEMLMVSQGERHPTELARLRGCRLAVGSETEQGKRWAEAKIKSMTGGDPISARFMRQDFFEFDPTFKLFIIGNHRPTITGVDEAMRRRLHLVPFTVTIPPEERDPELSAKLKAEWPAILRWMMDGCMAWQGLRLDPPAIVRAASESYMAAEDSLSLWLEEFADVGATTSWEAIATLWTSWRSWAERAGEDPNSQKWFSQALQERGLEPKRKHGGTRGFNGIRLRPVGNEAEEKRYGA